VNAIQQCPVERAVGVIGGRWKLLVLRSLLLNGAQRYNELLATVTGVSAKELTRNLRELMEAGLLTRDSVSAKVARYGLTERGSALMPVFTQLLEWGKGLPGAE
jgi:DNA-binding HxlR family transcriptional regulator